jgi:hypothetical protein
VVGIRLLARPQERGDLLEAPAVGQRDGVAPAVVVPVVAEHRDRGLDDELGAARGTARAAALGYPVDLAGVEDAAAVVGLAAGQHAAADIGVERRRLDPESPRSLVRPDPCGHRLSPNQC